MNIEDQIVCGYAEGLVEMTPELWARCIAERKRLGRMLVDEDVLALVEANKRGYDDA